MLNDYEQIMLILYGLVKAIHIKYMLQLKLHVLVNREYICVNWVILNY